MIYKTTLTIDTDIENATQAHQYIESLFSFEFANKNKTRKLFRYKQIESGKTSFIILSHNKPDLSRSNFNIVQLVERTTNFNGVKTNQRFQFSIILNPVKISNGKIRKSISDIQEQVEWFKKKSLSNGFELINVVPYVQQPDTIIKKKTKINLVKTLFTGTLKVTDSDKFKNALTNGIGRQKAHGFGLLKIWQ